MKNGINYLHSYLRLNIFYNSYFVYNSHSQIRYIANKCLQYNSIAVVECHSNSTYEHNNTEMSSENSSGVIKKRVLSIQSHVVHGYVGNKSATFPLQVNTHI